MAPRMMTDKTSTTSPVKVTSSYQDDDSIDLLALFGTLVDNKWKILGTTLFFLLLSVLYCVLVSPIYQSQALIQVEEKQGGLPGMEGLADFFSSTPLADTEIQIIKSRSVISDVVDDIGLYIYAEPKYFPIIGKAIYRHYKPIADTDIASPWLGLSSFAWGGEKINVDVLDVPEDFFNEELTLIAKGQQKYDLLNTEGKKILSGTVGNTVSSTNGAFRIRVANLAARKDTKFDLVRERKLTAIQELQQDIHAGESSKDSGIINLTYENENINLAKAVLDAVARTYVKKNVEKLSAEAQQSLNFLNKQLPVIKNKLEKSEAKLAEYMTSAESIDVTMEAQAMLDQVVDVEAKLQELSLKKAELTHLYKPSHPRYQALVAQLSELRAEKNNINRKINSLPKTQKQLLSLKRDVAVNSEIYTQLLENAQQLDVARAGTTGDARLVDDAAVDVEQPVRPNKPLLVIVLTLGGAILSIGFVFAREAFNKGVENPDEIEQLGLPVYASIPLSEQWQKVEQRKTSRKRFNQNDKLQLLAVENPADIAIESLRSLRTSLHFAMMEAKNNIIMISGPSPEVGKSFVSANLAAIIAQSGQRILVIDADLRKGYVHKMFKTSQHNGLSDLLCGRVDKTKAIRHTEIENLDVVPRGEVPPNPSELLMHHNFSDFLNQVSKDYDIVLVDTPPILAVTDPAIVGKLAGTALIVTRFAKNGIKEIEHTINRFEQNGITLKGCVFNGVERKASSSYSNYGYYHYSYGDSAKKS